jgi:hypothetical protein
MKSKQKGNAYECKIAKEMRELGYKDCLTSRYESQRLDDMKVDLTNTGIFYIQTKAVERGVRPHQTLDEMPKGSKINVILHKKNRQGEVAIMKKEDFYKLIKMLKKHNKHK